MFRWKEHKKDLVEFVEAAILLGFNKRNALEAWVAKHAYQTTYNSAMVVYYRERDNYLNQINPETYEMPIEDLELLYKAQEGQLESQKAKNSKSKEEPAAKREQVSSETDTDTQSSSRRHPKSDASELEALYKRIQRLAKDNPEVASCVLQVVNTVAQMIEVERERIRAEEAQRFQAAFDQLKKDVDKNLEQIHAQLNEQHKAYEALESLMAEFASLRTIDAVTSLRDYRNRMVTEVDKFNNVLKVTDKWAEAFENQLKEIFTATERRILTFKPRERQASA